MVDRDARTARAWAVGILGGLAILALLLSAAFGPEAMAEGAPMRLAGLEPRLCPGCPLCGMSRAFSCVTHAEFARAFEFNRGVLIAYPMFAALAVLGPAVLARDLLKRS